MLIFYVITKIGGFRGWLGLDGMGWVFKGWLNNNQEYDDQREGSHEACEAELQWIEQEKQALKDKDWDAYAKDNAACIGSRG